ncbi:phosphopantetheine-binding protein [Chitinophaga sp. 22536]
MVPAFFVRLTQLPLTPNGKINRKLLPPPEAGPRVYHPPQTETEKALAHLWENILQHPRISMNDNFFEIGGQSLKAIQVISKVFKDFSVKLELRDLFANPVLAQFTERVEIMMWLNAPAKPDLANNVDEIII